MKNENFNYKNIHIGSLIKKRVKECKLDILFISDIFECEIADIEKIYISKAVESNLLLIWCRLLNYDFFRIYTQHLILFSPSASMDLIKMNQTHLTNDFRKNYYTKEIINFILDLLKSEEKTQDDIVKNYRIPKTTLNRWIKKYYHAET